MRSERVARSCRAWVAGALSGMLVLAAGAAPCAAGGAVGVRFGWADVADEVFHGSGDLGGTDLVGLQVEFDLLPLLTTEIAGEYVSEPFSFREGLFAGFEAAGRGEYEDLALYASARLKLLDLLFLPVQGYAGGGVNVHFRELSIEEDTLVPASAVGDLEEAVRDVAGERTCVGWHVLAGLRLSFTGVPLSIFAEGRYADAFEEDLPRSQSLFGGVWIDL